MNTIYMVILIGYLRQKQEYGHQKCIFSKIFYFVYYLIYYVILKRIVKKRKNYMAICWRFFLVYLRTSIVDTQPAQC